MKKRYLLLILVLVLGTVFMLGPQPATPDYKFSLTDGFPGSYEEVDQYVLDQNSMHHIKPDNESRVYWANPDSIYRSEYALVYLHGFSASPGEGMPVHEEIAQAYDMNLYVPRLAHHGLVSDEPLLEFSSADFINSAYNALKIGELIGKKVIVMSCSTGSTAALYALANSEINAEALIMYSPNIELYDSKTPLLTIPWGLQIARMVKGGDYHSWDVPEEAQQYWYDQYRLEGVVELQNMLEHTMTKETFNGIDIPAFVGYYYKDEALQDMTVSVPAVKHMAACLSTPENELVLHAFPEVAAHALQSGFFSQDVEGVINETSNFLEKIVHIKKPASN